MILDILKQQALQSAKKNSLTLKSFKICEPFTYVEVTNKTKTSIGVALSPSDEGDLKNNNFKSIEDILEDDSFNLASRAITLATINAIGQYELQENPPLLKKNLRVESCEFLLKNSTKEDKMVFIGNLKPVIKKLKENSRDVAVFCRRKKELNNEVYNDIFEYEAVSKADIVVITGAALIGSTFDALLKFATKAKIVMVSGFSAGLNPIWLKNSNVTHVASLYLKDCSKEKIEKNPFEDIFENSCYLQKT
ncbi:hypothetical protein CRU96_05850 [Malaciobacter halophilus]|nr:DUF364 domain-containing protein [Malaciobacter halophilus]RYA23931.1 hypothetical protein CRU96_05850 [Malaciobacter halophilus]